ncbi:IQ-domain, partial [Sarracenia purpurea var. burkii]
EGEGEGDDHDGEKHRISLIYKSSAAVVLVADFGHPEMGKSPGKWIKTVLFGKKSSKSNIPKGREKLGNEKDVWVSAKASEADLALNRHGGSDFSLNTIATNVKLEEDRVSAIPLEGGVLRPGNRDADTQGKLDPLKEHERTRREHAATKAQAAFKGYLARRAFRALKGIIRLQALVRGHLVRRQAVCTLHCMLGIVKLQALVRGKNIRCSDLGLQVQMKSIFIKPVESKLGDPVAVNISVKISKLSENGFVRKLLASSPTVMPLQLQYGSAESNSVLNWLERWSASFFWKPISQTKKAPDSKFQKKQRNLQTIDTETGRIKLGLRRNPSSNLDNVSAQSTSETEKPRRNLRKILSHPANSVRENPQIDIEKVKRNLRKVHNPPMEGNFQSEVDSEKPKYSPGKVSNSSVQTTVEESISHSTEKIKKRENVTVVNEAINLLIDDQTAIESQPLDNSGKDECIPVAIEDLSSREEVIVNESQISACKASSTAKQDRTENGIQNRPTRPSYMAATESAKAKLRAQGSPKLGHDGVEKHNLNRRHSLPASTNSKASSPLPRTHRPIQACGKGGNRNDRSLSASRDGNVKVIQAEWRR